MIQGYFVYPEVFRITGHITGVLTNVNAITEGDVMTCTLEILNDPNFNL